MKKTEAFLFLAILLVPFIAYSQEASTGVGLTILDTTAPVINLTSPLNNSGNMNENVTFFYNVSDESNVENCSLIINNKINITDTSITKNAQINFRLNNTAIGIYNWSINCTNSLSFNGSSDTRVFSVFFLKHFNSTTTNLSLVNITNVTHFVIEESTAGKINFSESLDLSQGLDLDKYINVSFNRIELNSTALRELNKSATLYLYGLTFSNPRVVREGIACPSDICKEVSYLGGTFAFNITHFTTYSSEETPGGGGGDSGSSGGGGDSVGGGGGGGGSGPVVVKREFTLSRETLKVILKQGQIKEETFTIKNTGDVTLAIEVDPKNLENFVTFQDIGIGNLVLLPGQEQAITSVFKAHEDQKPDIYPGEILFNGQSVEKKIPTIVEVDSASPLFDVDVQVLPQYKSVLPGNDILIEVSLFNVRGFGRVDVNLEYSILDFKGNLIASEQETVAVETQAKFTRELLVPSDIIPGAYVASVKVTFEDSVGISSDLFEVKAKAIRLIPVPIRDLAPYLGGIVVVALIVYIFVMRGLGLPGKNHVPKTKEEESKLLKTEEKIKKLEKELAASESAYKSGFISEESYKNNKERVEKEMDKLRKE